MRLENGILIYDIEALSPYSENTIAIITNADDSIFPNKAATIDSVFNYVQLGDDLQDGLFPWIIIATNVTASYTESYSFELAEGGGEAVIAELSLLPMISAAVVPAVLLTGSSDSAPSGTGAAFRN
ncbi:putative Intradiol ring-cleavage dioxygenase [Seiridium unicorne]|uniref:Intradiol ring-cleavage dioxygenase n=1 Tax=Seiridium unicorne TaxID=138068 RepID=A0ABR2V476_9PEZI